MTHSRFNMRSPLLRFLFPLFIPFLCLIWNSAMGRAEVAGEYKIKAAFFYHFANFVDWPTSTFKATNEHLRICVMGTDLFGQTLDDMLSKKSVRNHPFEILRNPPTTQLPSCHVLYLPASASSKLQALRLRVADEDVLTVGETLEFMRLGGMVQFFIDNHKIRFAINTKAVNQTNLKVSSKLLRLAKIYTP